MVVSAPALSRYMPVSKRQQQNGHLLNNAGAETTMSIHFWNPLVKRILFHMLIVIIFDFREKLLAIEFPTGSA